jgi:hypothetical protein
MMDSSFGPMALMVISWSVGILVFPVAGAIWFTEDKITEQEPIYPYYSVRAHSPYLWSSCTSHVRRSAH